MKGKYTKITKGNIHLVKYRMSKLIGNKVIDVQWFYDKKAKRFSAFGLSGLIKGHAPILKSSIDIFGLCKFELERNFSFNCKPFIRISNHVDGYTATLIDIGNYIKYSKNEITVLCGSPNFTEELCRKVFTIRKHK